MELVLAHSALADLQDIRRHYSDEGVSEIGIRLVSDILEATERLVDHPDSGRKVPEFDQQQIRELLFSPYRVVYLREPSLISVVRIWREERELVLPPGCEV